MTKPAHARALALLLPLWLWAMAWLAPRMAWAATVASYDQGARDYNWLALGLAAGTGLWGGVLMLILALAMDTRVVTEVFKEGLRNAIVSPITGMAAYGVLEAIRAATGRAAAFELSFLLITLAGMGAIPLVGFFQGTARKGAPRVREGLIEVAISWLTKWKAPTKPPEEPKP